MSDTDDISRDYEFGVGPNGENMRVYRRGKKGLPSVTSVLSLRDEDTAALERWRETNDGIGDHADWRHLLWYTQNRGTLAHYAALNPLAGGELWSDDEEGSAWELLNRGDDYVSGEPALDVLYSLLKDEHEVTGKLDFAMERPQAGLGRGLQWAIPARCREDIRLFLDRWDDICSVLGITPESVIDVEQYLFDEQVGYAGQVDLIYRARDGATVCADLKTSAGIYDKHKFQSAAYAAAHPETIDRLEVIRIKPRRSWDVHTTPAWRDTTEYHTSDYWRQSHDELWSEFKDLAESVELQEGR